jgi:hypothetical protein
MSASASIARTWIARAKDQVDFRQSPEASDPREWIGVDFSGENAPRRVRKLLPLLILSLIAALGVSALRIDLIRTRYAMADALAEEKALITEQRELILRRRQLRDPVELAVQARVRGFRPPTQILSLPEPMIAGSAFVEALPTLPSVAAGPVANEARDDWQ